MVNVVFDLLHYSDTCRDLKIFLLLVQLGSYFGSEICAADVNGDQLDDVIIGAPLYSTNNTEEGRVYVYINTGSVSLQCIEHSPNSSMKAFCSHFVCSVAYLMT